MPKIVDSLKPLRILLFGNALLRKTDWCGQATKEGFNLIYLDGDGNPQVLNQLPPAAKDRVFMIDGVDTPEESNFAFLVTHVKKMDTFIWDETKKVQIPGASFASRENPMVVFRPERLTMNDIIVIDSWTAYVNSLQRRYFKEEGIDIDESTTIDTGGHGKDFRWTGAMCDNLLINLKTFPCHVIVIAHSETLEKKDEKGKTISTKHKVISSSRPQADKLPKFFTDVLHFTLVGTNIYIDTKPNDEILAGSRSIPGGKRETWDKFQFRHLAEAIGLKATGEECRAVQFYGPGELPGLPKPKPSISNASNGSSETIPKPSDGPAAPGVITAGTSKLSLAEQLKAKQGA